jgi:hypothetical protein
VQKNLSVGVQILSSTLFCGLKLGSVDDDKVDLHVGRLLQVNNMDFSCLFFLRKNHKLM